jgi:tripartite-type tricarboxylate transporter receptor subunit TctC
MAFAIAIHCYRAASLLSLLDAFTKGPIMLNRRSILRAGGALALPMFTPVFAQAGQVRMVVGFPAGGPVDIAARFICPLLSQRLGETFVTENMAGESGNTATGRVVSAKPDGQTLLLCGPVHTINTTLFPGLPFNFSRDLAAVAGLYRVPLVVEVHPGVPVNTASELIAFARSRPGQLRVGYAGKGTPQHIGIELFKSMAGIDMTLVPYLGSTPALEDLLAGRVDVMFDPMPSSIAHIRAGRLRPLAVTGAKRIGMLPDVPPMADVVAGYEAGSWFGISAPRGTPVERIAALNSAANGALSQPAALQRLNEMGATAMSGTPAEFADFIHEETAKYARVIATSKIASIPVR